MRILPSVLELVHQPQGKPFVLGNGLAPVHYPGRVPEYVRDISLLIPWSNQKVMKRSYDRGKISASLKKKKDFIYLFERDGEREQEQGEREKQAPH